MPASIATMWGESEQAPGEKYSFIIGLLAKLRRQLTICTYFFIVDTFL